MRSEESRTPLNQRAFKRAAKEGSTWSQIIFDSYKHLVNRLPLHRSWKYHLATWPLFGKWEPKGNQNTGQLGDEWRTCQLETIAEDWYMEGERSTEANPNRPLLLMEKSFWPEVDARPWKEIYSVKWRSCRQLLFSDMAMWRLTGDFQKEV